MTRTCFCLAALLAIACGNETELGQIEAEIEASPSLTDFGDVPVGASQTATVQLDHLKGLSAQVSNVALINIEGSFFHFDGPATFELDARSSQPLAVRYEPSEAGWHRATLEIVHNAEGGTIVVEIRGHGVVPSATVSPLAIDFGPVGVGVVAVRTVAVSNDSAVDFSIGSAQFPNGVYTLNTALPLLVPAGGSVDVPVQFAPVSDLPAIGSMTLAFGGEFLPTVSLRGNDCEGGDAAAYDVDRDGFTSCGGDCDDDNAAINPAADETFDFADEDCDGVIDEGTPGFDDDGDGFCDDDAACSDGSTPGDCNDGAAAVLPGTTEVLDNGVDDDCDGVVDLGNSDADGDGYAVIGGDCDDNDPNRSPANAETADGVDNDCDVLIDEGTSAFYDDNDGYCEAACTDSALPGDCDDRLTSTNPAAPELADWTDNDCDAQVDEGTVKHDDDGDGYTEEGGDCDDADALLNPGLGTC